MPPLGALDVFNDKKAVALALQQFPYVAQSYEIEDAKAKIKEIKNDNNNEGLLDGIYRTFINSDDKRSEKCSILLASLGHKIEDYGRYEICQFLFRHM